jgi:ATP-dependent RNA helicase DHX37/DHR1
LIVLATNVAETSLTIPGIRYVFDCGRHKERTWDRVGVQTFRTTWVSKASADQRTGRAGRTGPGHCYRLYSSAIFESAMPDFSQPEIFKSPLEGVVLQLKNMNIGRVDNFPWPTPPERGAVVKAERLLKNLGALDGKGRITKVGKELQNYPLSPRFAQMLRLGITHNCAREVIAVVAALDVPEIIIPENQLDLKTPTKDDTDEQIWTAEDDAAESARETRRKAYAAAQAKFSRLDFNKSKITPQADAMKLFAAVLDYAAVDGEKEKERFCRDNFLREKGMREVSLLGEQLTSIVANVNPSVLSHATTMALKKPSDKTVAVLKQIVASGFVDQIAIRADLLPAPPVEERRPKRAADVRYRTLFSSIDSTAGRSEEEGEDDGAFVYIHPSSLLARLPPNSTPRYIIYARLQRSQPSKPGARSRVRMHPLTPVSAEQIASLARGTGLLEIGKPMGKVDVLPVGEKGGERRECDVMLSLVGEGGSVGWPLCRKRVVQRRVPGEGWVVETWKN